MTHYVGFCVSENGFILTSCALMDFGTKEKTSLYLFFWNVSPVPIAGGFSWDQRGVLNGRKCSEVVLGCHHIKRKEKGKVEFLAYTGTLGM